MDSEHPTGGAGDYRVNFFRPRPGYMRRRVTYTWVLLISWAFFTFGFQFLLAGAGRNPAGESALTEATLLGFPFHFWFTAQFLIVWFIFLCFLFNLFVDHLANIYRKHR
jgi:putative solute:sodium symporter small subunit